MAVVAQPAGTVTLVFTDIEGSTRLLEELGTDLYREALAEHRRVLREACARHAGYEVDHEGDAFFYAFASAQAAVTAVSEAMQGLDGGPIRVRVGIHTGEPSLDPPKYVGLDVHRAARIMSAAHGAQVVLSPTTVALLRPGSFVLKDLGRHRLKDLSAPIPLAQLVVDGLPEAFPPLRSLHRTNLPTAATPFLGRTDELAAVIRLFREPHTRLLTLTGPGGTGKTRLALQAAAEMADDHPDGVYWAPLAPLRNPELVLSTIATALEVGESPGEPPVDTLGRVLRDRRPLLVLDNLEHLLPGAALHVSALLRACPTLRVLATSRERLALQAEREYPVESFTPGDARALLAERAAAAAIELGPEESAAELVERLDRLPLAIELAAARLRLFTPAQLLERLDRRFELLRGAHDADPRQQTLRATIEWSYDLLSSEERRLLRALSVFAGGCTYDAAEDVCGADPDTLQSLLDKSLVRRRDTREAPRYWMLETIREYASERLEDAGEGSDVRERHACWYQELVAQAEPQLAGAAQQAWLDRFADELDNIRAVLARLEPDRLAQLRMATPLRRFWEVRDHVREAQQWLEPSADLEHRAGADLATRANVAASRMAWKQGDLDRGCAYADRAHAIATRSEDERLMGLATENLGIVVGHGDMAAGRELLEESVRHYRSAADGAGLASALNNLGCAQLELGLAEAAAGVIEESLLLWRETSDDIGLAFALHTGGYAALYRGAPGEARPILEEALDLFHAMGDASGVADTVDGLAHCARAEGAPRRAAVLWGAGEALRERGGFEIQSMERRLQTSARPQVEAQLGAEELAAAWEEGRSLEVDEVVELARRHRDDPPTT